MSSAVRSEDQGDSAAEHSRGACPALIGVRLVTTLKGACMTIRIPRAGLLLAVAALALAGVGVGGFLIGRSEGRGSVSRSSPRAGFNAGYQAGYSTGNANGNASGYSSGRAAGLIAGREQGRQAGYTDGYNVAARKANGNLSAYYDDAFSQGANSVFVVTGPRLSVHPE